MTARQATRKTLRAAIAFALAFLMAWGGVPAPALAEMVEEAMGEEPVAAQTTGRDETKDKGAAPADAGLAPMTEEGAAEDVPDDAELAVEGLTAQDAAAPDELEVDDVPEAEAAADVEPGLSTQSVGRLYNPRVVSRSSMKSGQVATWDCVWFGSYPQTEVPETNALKNANWQGGVATVGGVRYLRVKRDEVGLASSAWGIERREVRYYRYEPIKWRVLEVNGDTALVVADKALDRRPYHCRLWTNVTWESSTIRSWLNGTGTPPFYTSDPRSGLPAQAFTKIAFTNEQLGAARQSTIASAANTLNGRSGGNATTDRFFLLSEADVHGASATAHGFSSNPDTEDEARSYQFTDYAAAFWSTPGYDNPCHWWLRSPGTFEDYAVYVKDGGSVNRSGDSVVVVTIGVRPAAYLNLSSPYVTWAGTVSSDGAVDTKAKPGSAPLFTDVPTSAWYADVVARATKLGLMSGYPNGRFGPADKVTRGQVAVILWNMAGNPTAGSGAKTFQDVKSSDYYYNAVRWASSKGVVSGYGNGKFGPGDNVSREQLAVMLANYARNVRGRAVSGSKSDFASMKDKDKDTVTSWAVSSVGWCFKNGILSGSGGNVNPHGNTDRAEAAKMVVVLRDLVG